MGDPCPVVPLASHIGVGDAERYGPRWECLARCTKRSEQSARQDLCYVRHMGGNSSKRAAVYSALGMDDAAFVSKDTEVVELVANMTSKMEMTGRG
uniref:Uncharacterized protein n=1 Tax=Parascaris equorum TaxID=6256 RepID=A0A914S0G1_PAREQ